jgi:SAM-dependent methyltransferase
MEVCFVCNEGEFDPCDSHYHSDRRKGLAGTWSIVKCKNCHIEFINPRPSENELNSFYETYYREETFVFRSENFPSLGWLRKLYHKFTGAVDPRDFIYPNKTSKMLDYGCGSATYIQYFHNKGYDISGADVSLAVVEESKRNGLKVNKVDYFNEIPFTSDQFDIVYLMQVFEHLRDPNTFLKELNRIMKSDGCLYISIPNANSIWRKIFKQNWVSGFFAPFHLAHYSQETFTVLAEKYGFEVKNCFYRTPDGWFRLHVKAYLHPEINNLDQYRSWLDSTFWKFLLNCVLRIVEIPFKNLDCMTLELRKVGS